MKRFTVMRVCGRGRYACASVVAAAVMAGAASSAFGDVSRFFADWWNPGGAPVSGDFSTTANWDGFVRPVSDGDGISNYTNFLSFSFSQPGTFVAVNDLPGSLDFSGLTVRRSGEIAGNPFQIDRHFGTPAAFIDVASGVRLVLSAPLRGSEELVIEGGGTLVMAPSNTGLHTTSGKKTVREGTTLELGSGPAIGSLAGALFIESGRLRATSSFALSIPCTVSTGSIDTPEGVTLTLSGGGVGSSVSFFSKTSPGTLAYGSGHSPFVFVTVVEGRVRLGAGAVDPRSEFGLLAGTHVELLGDNTLARIGGGQGTSGGLDVGSFTLNIRPPANDTFLWSLSVIESAGGVLDLDANPALVYEIGDASAFDGTLRVRSGAVRFGFASVVGPATVVDLGPAGTLQIRGDVGMMTPIGGGTIQVGSNRTLRLGGDGGNSTVGAALDVDPGGTLVKEGAGELYLTGDNSGFSGGYVVEAGGLYAPGGGGFGSPGSVHVEAGGLIGLPSGVTAIGAVTGGGTISVPGSGFLEIGGDGSSSAFGGVLASTGFGEIRKRGSGEWLLTADTTGFEGFLSVSDGTVRFDGGDIFPASLALSVLGGGALAGHGEIRAPMTSFGAVRADVAGEELGLSVGTLQNFGPVIAENGGRLAMSAMTVVQDPAGEVVGSGGVVSLHGALPLVIEGGAVRSEAGGVVAISAGDLTMRGVSASGAVEVAAGAGVVLDGSDIVMGAGSSVAVDAGGLGSGTAIFSGTGTVSLAGGLVAEFGAGYTGVLGDRVAIVDGPAVSGSLDGSALPDVSPRVWREDAAADRYGFVVSCLADVALPLGVVDIDDVLVFLDGFANGDPASDVASPVGVFDIDDVLAFLDSFAVGC